MIRLGADGTYEIAESTATHEDFLSCLSAYRALKRLEKGA